MGFLAFKYVNILHMLIANIFGIFIFFFILWKILKDDYPYEKIFNLGFLIVFGFVLGFLISYY